MLFSFQKLHIHKLLVTDLHPRFAVIQFDFTVVRDLRAVFQCADDFAVRLFADIQRAVLRDRSTVAVQFCCVCMFSCTDTSLFSALLFCFILQRRVLPPFYSGKYDLKLRPNYRYTAEADKKKNAFSLEQLINRRMKTLNPNEQYTVYEAAVLDETSIDEDEDIFNYTP